MEFSKQNYIVATITTATPAVITSNAHELYADDTIEFITSGALPTGLVVDTTYHVILSGITANTWQISTTRGGTALATTADGSGVHQWIKTNRARIEPFVEDNR